MSKPMKRLLVGTLVLFLVGCESPKSAVDAYLKGNYEYGCPKKQVETDPKLVVKKWEVGEPTKNVDSEGDESYIVPIKITFDAVGGFEATDNYTIRVYESDKLFERNKRIFAKTNQVLANHNEVMKQADEVLGTKSEKIDPLIPVREKYSAKKYCVSTFKD